MNIILWELKSMRKSMLIWSFVFIIFLVMMFSEFSAYYDNPEMGEILDLIPEGFLEAFGMAGANLTTINGFLSVMVLYVHLMVGVYGILLGSNIIGKEERDKTAEFLMIKPVTREKIIITKIVSAIISSLLMIFVIGMTLFAALQPYHPTMDNYRFIGIILGGNLFVMWIYLFAGLLIASVLKRFKKIGGISIAAVLITYLLSVIATLSDSVEFLKYVSPFSYFEGHQLFQDMGYEPGALLFTSLVILIASTGIFLVYPRRDLRL